MIYTYFSTVVVFCLNITNTIIIIGTRRSDIANIYRYVCMLCIREFRTDRICVNI